MPTVFNPASWTPVVLAWSFLLLLPFGRSSELPVFIIVILGGILILKYGKQVTWQGSAGIFSLLFLCIWVLIALSVSNSLWFQKSPSTHTALYSAYWSLLIWWVIAISSTPDLAADRSERERSGMILKVAA